MNSKLKAYLEVTRPFNVGITFVSILAACYLANREDQIWSQALIASLVGALIAAGANAINDYFDIDIDRINKPYRPLPRGALEPRDVFVLWFALTLIGILLNLFLNFTAIVIAVAASLALYGYSARLKRTVLAGNLLVGIMTGLAFVYGAVAVGKPERSWIPALFAFLINVGREIVKDIEDIEGDSKNGAETLPVKHGVKPSLVLATTVLLILVGTTVIPYVTELYNFLYIPIVLIVDILVLLVVVSMWMNSTPKNLSRLSILLKVSMPIGLVAIYLGS
jgi:geranylgeranylglycerol-phosphate geranylgeranyltransferase